MLLLILMMDMSEGGVCVCVDEELRDGIVVELSGVGHYSQKSDVYSYGVLMVSLWNQKPPYSEMNVSSVTELFRKIVSEGVRPGIESTCPQSYFNLAHACMVENPHSRPSFSEIWKNVFDS